MPLPPTIREIAAAAGVHHTTMSRALRNHPDISPARAEELRAFAKKMGYVPDPMLSALAAYRTRRRPAAFHSVIAWLNPSLNRSEWKRFRTYRMYYESAAARARELGYQLDEIVLPRSGDGALRVTSMLNARNISGVIVGPTPVPGMRLDMIDWRPFSAVRIGESLSSPRLHAITAHHSQSMLRVMRELKARGYRRPGLFVSLHLDERTSYRWSSAFLRTRMWFGPEAEKVPLCLFPEEKADMSTLVSWVREARPDVIVAVGEPALLPTLRNKAKLKVPEDVGLCVLVQPDDGEPITGIDENNPEVGAAAVNQLVAMMNRQERGVPARPHSLRIDNLWVEAGTLRPRPDSADADEIR